MSETCPKCGAAVAGLARATAEKNSQLARGGVVLARLCEIIAQARRLATIDRGGDLVGDRMDKQTIAAYLKAAEAAGGARKIKPVCPGCGVATPSRGICGACWAAGEVVGDD